MADEHWQRVQDLLIDALDQPPEERHEFVDQRCAGDVTLRDDVRSLLDADPDLIDSFDKPLVRLLEPDPQDTSLGRYEVLRTLGSGGGGVVYLARRADGEYHKHVAIKVSRRGLANEQARRRFLSERQILAGLEHPNIARLWDGGTTSDGRPYIVMEAVDGPSIDAYCRQLGLSIRQRLELFLKVCGAVQLAHRNLIIHRDLKPSNILVGSDGEPKLLDFGIAKNLDPEMAHLVTETDADLRVMTPQYASPEQVRGGAVTTATDVYGLGLVLYEMLTGQRPFDLTGKTLDQARELICEREPMRPSTAVRRTSGLRKDPGHPVGPKAAKDLSGDLDSIVLKALRKEPELRYSTVERLAADIRRHLEGRPVEARRGTLPYRLGKLLRRHAKPVIATGLLLTLLSAFAIDRELQSRKTEQARHRAEAAAIYLAEMFLFSRDTAREAHRVIPREMLDQGATMLGELDGMPELRAELMTAIGRGYLALSLTREAEPLIEGALELGKQTHAESSQELVERRFDLAWLRGGQGRFQEAEAIYREIQATTLKHWGDEPAKIARMRNALAANLLDQGRYEEAGPLFEQALAAKKEVLGEHHQDVTAIAGNLGATYYYQGQYRAAAKVFRQQLASLRRHHPDHHGQVRAAKINLAASLREMRSYDEAELLLTEMLILDQQDPPSTGRGKLLEHLAENALMMGELEKAETQAQEVISLYRGLVESDHPDLARAQTLLARILLSRGDAEQAEALLRRAEIIYSRGDLADHWQRAETASLLGASLLAQGRLEEAGPLLKSSLEQIQRQAGPKANPAREAAARLRDFEQALAERQNHR